MIWPSIPQILEGAKLFRGHQDLGDSYFLPSFPFCVVFHSKPTIGEQIQCVKGFWRKRCRKKTRKLKSESLGVTVNFVTLGKSLTYGFSYSYTRAIPRVCTFLYVKNEPNERTVSTDRKIEGNSHPGFPHLKSSFSMTYSKAQVNGFQ